MPWGLALTLGTLEPTLVSLLGGSLLSVSPVLWGFSCSLCLSWGNSQPGELGEKGSLLGGTGGGGWGGWLAAF